MFVAQKVKLDSSVCHILQHGDGMTTIYDLNKLSDKLLKFCTKKDEQNLMKNRKILA